MPENSYIPLNKEEFTQLVEANIILANKLEKLAESIEKICSKYVGGFHQTSELYSFLREELPEKLDAKQRQRWNPWIQAVMWWAVVVVCFGSLVFVAVWKANATEFEKIVYNIVAAAGGGGLTKALQKTRESIDKTKE